MNNISAINQVLANIHQSVSVLGGRVNAVFVEVEAVKSSVRNVEQSQKNILETSSQPTYVTIDCFDKVANQVGDLKIAEGDTVSKVRQLETLVIKQENELKDIAETVAGLKIVCDNLTSSVTQIANIPSSLTKEDVQALIDSAINALIGVLTSTGNSVQPSTSLTTIPEDDTRVLGGLEGIEGLEVVDAIDIVEANGEDEVQVGVESEQPVTEVMVVEPTKKKGRGGRKSATKK
jgi:hypothetical protein